MDNWILAHGGLVGLGVLLAKYVLIGFSVASVTVMIERQLALGRVRRAETDDYDAIRSGMISRDWARVHALSETPNSPATAILATGLEYQNAGEARLRESMNQAATEQLAYLQHNLPVLATAASTAPYVGLLGTVLGILAAFRDIAVTGQTGASVIAGSISEALTATALGLGVAIPAVVAYNYFTARINSLSLEIETHALDIAERVVTMAGASPGGVAPRQTVPGSAPVATDGAGQRGVEADHANHT